jgi:outer membrane receptor protein involved in Fe transport
MLLDLGKWLLAAGALFPLISAAAEEFSSSEPDEPLLEEVVVLGYHIRRTDTLGPAPVTVIDREALQATGFNTLAEVARALPSNVQGLTDGGSRTLPTSGTAQFDLRGLGVDATLVLINGRRVAPHGQGQFNDYFVDLNSIPVAAIERIEVLTDGASALYGSDAMAGVVNIVLRDTHSGIEFEARYQGAANGSHDEWSLFATGGWAGEAVSAVTTVSLFEADPFFASEHPDLSDFDFTERGGPNDRSLFSSPPTLLFFDAASPLGFRVVPDEGCGQDASTSESVVIPGLWVECVFNPAPYTTEIAESRRIGANLFVDWAISEQSSAFLAFFANRNESSAATGPTLVNATPLDTPFGLPLVPAQHPDNPLGVPLLLGYRSLPSGARINETETDLLRLVAGIAGRRESWNWEVSGAWSRSDVSNHRRNYVQSSAFQEALLGLGGPGRTQFFNPFGLSPQNDPAVVEQFTVNVMDGARTEESALDLQLTGAPMRFAAGPLGLAIGAQYRHQTLSQSLDPLEAAGDVIGALPRFAIDADRDIWAVYAELSLQPFDNLEVQLAARHEDYSDFGGTTNPKVSLGWTPTDALLLRASWGTSFRAPSFQELREPRVEFTELVVDTPRCERTGAIEDCAELPYAASLEGNAGLDPEEGESWNAGLVWQPSSLPGLLLSADLWEVTIDQRVLRPEPQFFVDNLPDQPEFVIRADPTPDEAAAGIPGRLEFVRTTYLNAEKTTASGLDFKLVLQGREAWRFELSHTYLADYELQIATTTERLAGAWLTVFPNYDAPLPRNRSVASGSWEVGRHLLGGHIRYVHGFRSPENRYEGGVDSGEAFHVGSWTTLDLSWELALGERSRLRLGCRNCLDEDPPVLNTYLRSSPYDYRGTLLNLRWTFILD